MPLAGDIVRASDDVLLTTVGCRLRRAANQSYTSAANTPVSWDTEDEDTHGFITVTGTTVTIPTGYDGVYAIAARVVVTLTASTRSFVEITPTTSIAGTPSSFRQTQANSEAAMMVAVTIPLLAGDTFLISALQTTGSSQNLTAWLSCYRIGVFD